MTAKKSSKANEKYPQITKITKKIQNSNVKSLRIKSRHSHPQQDDDKKKQQPLAYARHKSASSESMNQFIGLEQFNALINDMSKLNEVINEIQDRIDFMNAKLDKLIAMFQRNNQIIAFDVNFINEMTPSFLFRTSNTYDIIFNDLIMNLFP